MNLEDLINKTEIVPHDSIPYAMSIIFFDDDDYEEFETFVEEVYARKELGGEKENPSDFEVEE